jgi:osmotically-inducible protein OsmY
MSGKLRKLVIGGLVASVGAIVLDQRRRAAVTERVERAGRGVGARVYGTDVDDTTLTHKVESEIFRDDSVPKGQINVNAQEGVVQLRGEVPSEEMVSDLVEKTRSVEGVRDVENLLHLPGSPAPMHE